MGFHILACRAPLTLKSHVMLVVFVQLSVPRVWIGPEMVNILMTNILKIPLYTEIKLPFCLQAKKICEVGLEVGSSSISCLGDPLVGK